MAHEIFISYRRKDTGGYAGRLYDYLAEKFGQGGVLFDVEVEGTAEVLRDWVSRVLPDSAVELVLIGEEWMTDRHGRRRLHETNDIVRLEVELALNHKVPIVPVLVDGASFPNAADLPETIKELTRFKGYEVNNSYWEAKLELIVEAVSSVVRTHVPILNRGVTTWNAWRTRNPSIAPNLDFGNFAGKDLDSADLSNASLCSANLSDTTLRRANLKSADLSQARLAGANLQAALLTDSNLRGAHLERAVLTHADLFGADLSFANLNEADLEGANIAQCWVYGVSVWSARLENAIQRDLLLTLRRGEKEVAITVDSIQMAVVIHLLLTSGGVRELIEVLNSKMVLVLGRFSTEGKAVMDAIKDRLRANNYVPVIFDFDTPGARDRTETISLLAHMSRFMVADLSTPKAVPAELMHVVPLLPSVPVVPLLRRGESEFALFDSLHKFPWVLEPVSYTNEHGLLSAVDSAIIARAETYLARPETNLTQRHERTLTKDVLTTVPQPTVEGAAPNEPLHRRAKKRRR